MEEIYYLYLLVGSIVGASIYGFSNMEFIQSWIFNEQRIQNNKEYYRMITSSFLHGDYMHLFFNMFVLYHFGEALLYIEGWQFFYLIYFASVLGGSVLSYFLHLNEWMYTALGASGGVTGVLMAFVVLLPDQPLSLLFLPIPIPGYIFVFLYLCYEVYMMINPKDNIGHDAHLGGAIVGSIFTLFFVDHLDSSTMLKLGLISLPLIYALVYSVKKIQNKR